MIAKCYAGKILYVNLDTKKLVDVPLDREVCEEFIGGKGLATKILYDFMSPKTGPLHGANTLAIMTGALNPYMPKFTVTSKSPLTNTICTSNCGGSFGSMLKKAGYDGIVIQGKADSLTYLKIDENISFEDAKDLESKLISETERALPKDYSKIIIGPAGENLVSFASIFSDGRFAGRGGLGAVLGSKNLKAIIVKGGKEEYEFSEEFKEFYKKASKDFAGHARTQSLKKYGTANLVLPGAILGYTPVENYNKASKKDIEKFEKISGEAFAEDVVGNASCIKCPVSCGKKIKLDQRVVKRPEYESIAFLGPNLGNYDKKAITKLNELCDELGLDTISTGAVLGYAMATDAFPLKFGKNQNLEDAIKKIAYKEGYGKELAKGVKKLSEKYGKKDAMHVKGLEIAAYVPDYRVLGQALGYLTNPRGACHLNSPTAVDEITFFAPLEPNDTKGKPEMVAFLEELDNVMDSMGMCRFTAYAFIRKSMEMPHNIESKIFRNLPKIALSSIDISTYHRLLSLATGKKFSKKKILQIGRNISKLEHDFNRESGHKLEEDSLPEGLLKNLTEFGDVEEGRALLKSMLSKYLKLRK